MGRLRGGEIRGGVLRGGGEGEGVGDKLGVREMSGERLWWRVVYGRIRGGGVFGSGQGRCFFSMVLCFSVSFPKICVIIPKN